MERIGAWIDAHPFGTVAVSLAFVWLTSWLAIFIQESLTKHALQ
jgi:hypothetical protein